MEDERSHHPHTFDPAPLTTTQQHNTVTGIDTDQRSEVEQSDVPDGTADRHSSPIPPHTSSISTAVSNQELERQLQAAFESQQQLENDLKVSQSREIKLQNELNVLHENQLTALEQVRREQANRYESQIASLQSSMVQTESSLQDLEKQLLDAKASHAGEVERLFQTQENIRETMLKERDQKHAEHIARITQEMSAQQDIADKDEDEREAERLKMIKEKMREMHYDEIHQLNEKHAHELKAVREDCQAKLESYRVETEKLANSKIQEMYAQFMAAHQAVVEQKNASDAALQELTAKLDSLKGQYDVLVVEKSEVEDQCQSMIAAHSAEMERARGDSLSLEQKLDDWKEKAASLESRLQSTHTQSSHEIDELRHHSEEELARVKSQYESKIQSLQSLVDNYQSQLQTVEEEHQSALQEAEERHQSELDELRGSHATEVSLLESSMAESTSNRASLELAEEHMKELQKQLEGYRRQESNLQGQISELQRQHNEEVETLRQELEANKTEEVKRVSTVFSLQIQNLEAQLSILTAQLEAKQQEDSDDPAEDSVAALNSQHQKEILELQTNLLSRQEQALEGLRRELQMTHTKEIADLQLEHSKELDGLKRSLVKEWSSRLDHEKSLLVAELDEVRRSEMSRLDKEHRQVVQKLRESLSQSGQSAVAKAEQRAAELGAELRALQEEKSTWEATQEDLLSQLELARQQVTESTVELEQTMDKIKQLSEDCQRYQDQVKNLEAGTDATKSAHEREKQTLSEELEGWKVKVNELQSQVEELQANHVSTSELSQELAQLTDQIAAKNVTVADLQAQNDMLNTEVFSLTQKCQKHIATSDSLQKQLESSWGANEEIEALCQKVAGMKHVNEECSVLKEKVNSLELLFADKAMELEEIVNQLEAAKEQARTHQHEAEIAAMELECLRKENAQGATKQVELQQQVDHFQSNIEELTTQNAEGVATIASLKKTIQDLECQIKSASTAQEDKNTSQYEELVKNFEHLQSDFDTLRAERDRLVSDLDQLREENARALEEQRAEWEEKLNEREKERNVLRSKLDSKESELTELRETVTTQGRLGVVVGEKSELEEGLAQARNALTGKLHEKSLLEKELSYHRIELERRLKEKQRLEELLFEKSRFEQELQSQRKQLQEELEVIESRLKLKDVEYEQREEQLKHEHSNELNHVRHDLRQKHRLEIDGMQSRHNAEVIIFS